MMDESGCRNWRDGGRVDRVSLAVLSRATAGFGSFNPHQQQIGATIIIPERTSCKACAVLPPCRSWVQVPTIGELPAGLGMSLFAGCHVVARASERVACRGSRLRLLSAASHRMDDVLTAARNGAVSS